jgi:capsular polysaccharide biosynthesis protein
LTVVVVTLFLIFRFLLDRKIRDEEDIVRIMGKNAIIGQVPQFE